MTLNVWQCAMVPSFENWQQQKYDSQQTTPKKRHEEKEIGFNVDYAIRNTYFERKSHGCWLKSRKFE